MWPSKKTAELYASFGTFTRCFWLILIGTFDTPFSHCALCRWQLRRGQWRQQSEHLLLCQIICAAVNDANLDDWVAEIEQTIMSSFFLSLASTSREQSPTNLHLSISFLVGWQSQPQRGQTTFIENLNQTTFLQFQLGMF